MGFLLASIMWIPVFTYIAKAAIQYANISTNDYTHDVIRRFNRILYIFSIIQTKYGGI